MHNFYESFSELRVHYVQKSSSGDIMMRSVGAVGGFYRNTVVRSVFLKPMAGRYLRLARTGFAYIFSASQLVLAALILTGCANQSLIDSQSTVPPSAAQQNQSTTAPKEKTTANRKSSPSFDEPEAIRASRIQKSSLSGSEIPINAEPAPMVQPESTIEVDQSAPSPDPRTLHAKNCRDKMIIEHPTVLFGEKGSAEAQRNYFYKCMRETVNVRR